MKYFILITFILQCSICFAQDNVSCELMNTDSENQKVDSLFNSHLNSLKKNIKDNVMVNKAVSREDYLFLEFFYYLSGIKIGERKHTYGNYPIYIKSGEIKEVEDWYNYQKKKITWENVSRIYFLLKQMKSIQSKDINELESAYKKIDEELEELRIK